MGEFHNDYYEGVGKYYCKSGTIIEGQWIKDKKEGYGITTYKNWNRYEGSCKDDDWNGFGIYFFADGEKHITYFVNGEKHGYAKIIVPNKSTYRGFLSKEYSKDLEYKDLERLKDTKENSMIIKETVMGFIIIQMETNMKENGKMVRNMESENTLIKMVIVIQENSLMINLKE